VKVSNRTDLKGLIAIGCGAYKEYSIYATRIRCGSFGQNNKVTDYNMNKWRVSEIALADDAIRIKDPTNLRSRRVEDR
jgi:hypothetical protein